MQSLNIAQASGEVDSFHQSLSEKELLEHLERATTR